MKLPRASSLIVSLGFASVLGCIEAPEPTKQNPAAPAAATAEPPAPASAKPVPVTAETDEGLKPTTEPLTAEELRLIAADPKTLTPEESVLRAHALRKKIMLNPNSDSAKALNEARAAVLTGEANPKPDGAASEDKGLVLQAPDLKQPPADAPK